jgi:hypothetical protein
VFASPTGGALNPNTDYHEWKSLLEEAGVRESRLHDARHTAATVLLLLEVPLRTVMSIMGWSNVEMVARYQHITDAIRQKVAGQVDQVIWQTTSSPGDTGLVTVQREALAVILPIVDIGLAHSGVEALADLEDAITPPSCPGGRGRRGQPGRGPRQRLRRSTPPIYTAGIVRFQSFLVSGGGGCEIRTREGLHPTRFPSVRPRPLGESSAG